MKKLSIALSLCLAAVSATTALANTTAQTAPYAQDWSNTSLITVDNDWANVPGCQGFRGDGLAVGTGVDPQTVLVDGTTTPVSLYANKPDPTTFFSGGVTEYELADPSIALAGSGTAAAPFLLVNLNTTAMTSIRVQYDARDVEAGVDNAVQQLALHYRVGNTGTWTNVPAAYIADATDGPNLATKVTHVDVTLPTNANNQALVQIRVMTTNAPGNDEWVGIDNVRVTGNGTTPVSPTTWGGLKSLFR